MDTCTENDILPDHLEPRNTSKRHCTARARPPVTQSVETRDSLANSSVLELLFPVGHICAYSLQVVYMVCRRKAERDDPPSTRSSQDTDRLT